MAWRMWLFDAEFCFARTIVGTDIFDMHLQTAGDSSLMDDSIGPGGVRGGPSFRTMSKQDYLLLYGVS